MSARRANVPERLGVQGRRGCNAQRATRDSARITHRIPINSAGNAACALPVSHRKCMGVPRRGRSAAMGQMEHKHPMGLEMQPEIFRCAGEELCARCRIGQRAMPDGLVQARQPGVRSGDHAVVGSRHPGIPQHAAECAAAHDNRIRRPDACIREHIVPRGRRDTDERRRRGARRCEFGRSGRTLCAAVVFLLADAPACRRVPDGFAACADAGIQKQHSHASASMAPMRRKSDFIMTSSSTSSSVCGQSRLSRAIQSNFRTTSHNPLILRHFHFRDMRAAAAIPTNCFISETSDG